MSLTALPNAEPIPGYRLIERLGRGGFGEVWKAEAPGGIHKAIKFVYGDVESTFGNDGQMADQEYKSLNRVKGVRHPFILSIERFEVIDGRLTIVMELADRNLWDRFAECQAAGLPGIPRPELIRYMEEAAEALDVMNIQHQIQHLDIKPQNIFLVHQHVKIADFGLAKDLEGGQAILTGGVTPTYAPPETFEGMVSQQSDQYSLAIVFQEMLTGRRPFDGTNTRQLVLQHMTAVPDVSSLQTPDREAVLQALSKLPGERFINCSDFVRALKGEHPVRVFVPHVVPVTALADSPTPVGLETDIAPVHQPKTDARRSLPPLVTRRGRSTIAASATHLRRTAPDTGLVSNLPPAPQLRTGPGSLFPGIIIGVGGTGLAVLRGLRAAIAARWGSPTLPNLRWLFIDTDQAAIDDAVTGAHPLRGEEVFLARLQRPSYYLTRDTLPPIDGWLPVEELYKMPKTPLTCGRRFLGRLALVDQHHGLESKLRAALEPFLASAPLDEAERRTGLGIRINHPRAYIAAGLGGGTGSGMLIDLAYLMRREMRRVGFRDSHVIGLLGAPTPPNTPMMNGTHVRESVMQNVRATMTELHHFARGDVEFSALLDTRQKPLTDSERPFRRCNVVACAGGSAVAADQLAGIAFAEILSPIGRAGSPDDLPAPASPMVISGMCKTIWPRDEVVRTASRHLVRSLLTAWAATPSSSGDAYTAEGIVATTWHERKIDRSGLRRYLSEHLEKSLGGSIEQAVRDRIAPLEDDSVTDVRLGTRVRGVVQSLLELLGKPLDTEAESAGVIVNSLTEGIKSFTDGADRIFFAVLGKLIETPGQRLAGADRAAEALRRRIEEELELTERESSLLDQQTAEELDRLLVQVGQMGKDATSKTSRPSQAFAQSFRVWAMARYEAILIQACANVYRVLRGNMPEYVREVNSCRRQLTTFVQGLIGSNNPRTPSAAINEVFPSGATSVEQAATAAIAELTAEDRGLFDHLVQSRVREECRGIARACQRPADVGAQLVQILTEEAVRFLDSRTPKLSATDILKQGSLSNEQLTDSVRELIGAASPKGIAATATILGLPPGDAGNEVRQVVRSIGGIMIQATLPDDLLIIREARNVGPANNPFLSGSVAVDPLSFSRLDINWNVRENPAS